MSDSVVVRVATVDDVRTIARHRAAMFRDMGRLAESLVEPLVQATATYLAAAVPAGEYFGWLAVPADRPEQVVAGVGVQLRRVLPQLVAGDREIALGPQGIVVNVYTEPAWRRIGLAERLMGHVLDWARDRGLASVVLHASPQARPLYERLGFLQTNEMRYGGSLGARDTAAAAASGERR